MTSSKIAWSTSSSRRDVPHAQRLRVLAKSLHETVAVEPPFAPFTKRSGDEILDVQPRKLRMQCVPPHERDVRAKLPLQRVVFAKRGLPSLRGEEKITAFVQLNRRLETIDFKEVANTANKLDNVQRHLNVKRRGTMLPDRCGRKRRR